MTTHEWSDTATGHTFGAYEIRRVGTSRWSIEVNASLKPTLGHRDSDDVRLFNSLRSARATALHLEVVRVRRIKLIRHVTLSIVMLGLSVAFYSAMSAGTEVNRLELFTLAAVSVFVALSESLDAFVLLVADGWDHRYEVPKLSRLDKYVSLAVISALWRKPRSRTSCQQSNVRTLT